MRVLLVEDEVSLAESLADGLRHDGHQVSVVHDGAAALVAAGQGLFDVVVLDRDLPILSGDAVCQALAASSYDARILMLTAADSVSDRVEGLDLGADDYLVKPFAFVELLARLRALARRGGGARPVVLERSGIRVDTTRRLVERDGRPVRLTPKELEVLELLLQADGGFVAVDELLDAVWDGRFNRDRAVVKVVVYAIRGKLGLPSVIESAPGLGYRIA